MKYILQTCCIVHFVVYKSHSYENKKIAYALHRLSPPRRLCSLYRLWPPRPPSPLLTISVVAAVASAHYGCCGRRLADSIGCGRRDRRLLCSLYRLWPPRPPSPPTAASAKESESFWDRQKNGDSSSTLERCLFGDRVFNIPVNLLSKPLPSQNYRDVIFPSFF
jgi:hypothetical protein